MAKYIASTGTAVKGLMSNDENGCDRNSMQCSGKLVFVVYSKDPCISSYDNASKVRLSVHPSLSHKKPVKG